jgi:hypothetical protein
LKKHASPAAGPATQEARHEKTTTIGSSGGWLALLPPDGMCGRHRADN